MDLVSTMSISALALNDSRSYYRSGVTLDLLVWVETLIAPLLV